MTDDPRRARVAKAVRLVLSRCARKDRKQPFDELDHACLDLAANTQTVVLILDARMKHGVLSPYQAEAYAAAVRDRDGALGALKIANPYRARAN
jgi:hypothetical protein